MRHKAYADWADQAQLTERPGKCNDCRPLKKTKQDQNSGTDEIETTTYLYGKAFNKHPLNVLIMVLQIKTYC